MNQWILILLVLVVTNIATGYTVWKNSPPKVDPQRDMRNALTRTNELQSQFVVIIGDSITQNSNLPAAICGLPLVNAGVGGMRASNFIPLAEDMAQLKPVLIVVALGINDAGYHSNFRTAYTLLLDSLPKSPLILATLAPSNRGGVGSISASIREVAASREVSVIDLSAIVGLETLDGIHPTEATYHLWRETVVSGIERALRC